jgi:hypothetical protein
LWKDSLFSAWCPQAEHRNLTSISHPVQKRTQMDPRPKCKSWN